MRLGISNIAWDVIEDEAVADLLQRFSIDAVDIAPGKYFPVPAQATPQGMERVKTWWASKGIELTGMQALLFGTSGLNVFGNSDSQRALHEHLAAVCRIGAGVGATRIVFGSPKNRDRSGLSDEQASDIAVRFFTQLAQVASDCGVIICLEPNPPCYQANFMTNSEETALVVQAVDHPSICMQFDTGALTINGEDPNRVLQRYAGLIGHVHASEPDLLPLGDGGTDHNAMATALGSCLPDSIVTIEMVATQEEPHLAAVERALDHAVLHYRSVEPGAGR